MNARQALVVFLCATPLACSKGGAAGADCKTILDCATATPTLYCAGGKCSTTQCLTASDCSSSQSCTSGKCSAASASSTTGGGSPSIKSVVGDTQTSDPRYTRSAGYMTMNNITVTGTGFSSNMTVSLIDAQNASHPLTASGVSATSFTAALTSDVATIVKAAGRVGANFTLSVAEGTAQAATAPVSILQGPPPAFAQISLTTSLLPVASSIATNAALLLPDNPSAPPLAQYSFPLPHDALSGGNWTVKGTLFVVGATAIAASCNLQLYARVLCESGFATTTTAGNDYKQAAESAAVNIPLTAYSGAAEDAYASIAIPVTGPTVTSNSQDQDYCFLGVTAAESPANCITFSSGSTWVYGAELLYAVDPAVTSVTPPSR